MIVRVFSATVRSEHHEEFESKLRTVSVPLVEQFDGLRSAEIARPLECNPDDFLMITRWASLPELIEFTGENWAEPFIPSGLERYVVECRVAHYESVD